MGMDIGRTVFGIQITSVSNVMDKCEAVEILLILARFVYVVRLRGYLIVQSKRHSNRPCFKRHRRTGSSRTTTDIGSIRLCCSIEGLFDRSSDRKCERIP